MNEITQRPWGCFTVLYEGKGIKVKELVVDPGKSLSMQRHFKRAEEWFIAEGTATVWTFVNNVKEVKVLNGIYQRFYKLTIPLGQWHQLENQSSSQQLKIIEIQCGDECIEEDIERK